MEDLNPFDTLENVQQDYLTYDRTFQRFQNQRIEDWITERIEHGTLLWKPPFVQLSPFATKKLFSWFGGWAAIEGGDRFVAQTACSSR